MADFCVMDLDNCLICSKPVSVHEIGAEEPDVFYISDVFGQVFRVQRRRHLDTFLENLRKTGKRLIVWSTGLDLYVKTICDIVFGRSVLEYILTRNHKTVWAAGNKNIAEIVHYIPDFDLNKAVLIDDTADNGADNPHNLIVVEGFYGNQDDELIRVMKKLESWKPASNAPAVNTSEPTKTTKHVLPKPSYAGADFA